MKISKIDSAIIQIDSAIIMYFLDQDIIPIITLIGASTVMLQDICNAKSIDDPMLAMIKPEDEE